MTAPPRRIVAALASTGAWLFGAGSLFALGWTIWNFAPAAESSTLVSVTVDGVMRAGPGFAYRGPAGSVLLWTETALVLAGLVMSVVPATAFRRTGHAILVAWALLCLGNTAYVAVLAPSGLMVSVAVVVAVLAVCTVDRARRGWS